MPEDMIDDEGRVPAYELPALLRHADGSPVTATSWPARRAELLDAFRSAVYGRAPTVQPQVTLEQLREDLLPGAAVRRRCLLLRLDGELEIHVLLYTPAELAAPAPVFVGLNFGGNHSVDPDQAVPVDPAWIMRSQDLASSGGPGTPQARGMRASRWSIAEACGRGYAVLTAAAGSFAPDCADDWAAEAGVFRYARRQATPEAWGTIAAWAWGLSRLADAVVEIEECDAQRIFSIGHSRMGKAALWAAAQDERFRLAVSSGSGCGGAALARRRFGERVAFINDRFPHWFALAHRAYNERETDLPVDQHQLLALLAPRPLYVMSAERDQWADPLGEFLSCVHAAPAWELLGSQGLAGVDEQPPLNYPVWGDIAYHIRPGPHDLTAIDWHHVLRFSARHFG